MKITIGIFDPETKQVPVSFVYTGVTHDRRVNACLGDDGSYDADATRERVADVARGVEAKIAAGAIANPPQSGPVSD